MKHNFMKYSYSYRLWDPVVEHIKRNIHIYTLLGIHSKCQPEDYTTGYLGYKVVFDGYFFIPCFIVQCNGMHYFKIYQ